MSHTTARMSRFREKLKVQPPDQVVRDVGQCQYQATQAIVFLTRTDAGDKSYSQRLVEAGLITTVLQLLERCEDEKFADVLGHNGDLPNPALWLNVLQNIVARDNIVSKDVVLDARVKIARGIGPVVRCMTDDHRRLFFGENMYWWLGPSILFFVALLENLTKSPETVPILMQYQGLTEFLIQCMFWERYRPDILEESRNYASATSPNMFKMIQNSAIAALQEFVDVDKVKSNGSFVRFSDEGTKRLKMIASTKIISDKYNRDCNEPFSSGWFVLMSADAIDPRLWFILQQLIWANCVDTVMIYRMVEYAMMQVKYSNAQEIIMSMYDVLIPRSGIEGIDRRPSDDRYSIAIKAGFIEMCLKLIVQFGPSGTRELSKGRTLDYLGILLNGASAVSLLKKSEKAVRNHRSEIQRALHSTMGKTEGKSSELLEMVRSMINMNIGLERKSEYDGSAHVICRRCLETLQADQIKRCSKCHRGG